MPRAAGSHTVLRSSGNHGPGRKEARGQACSLCEGSRLQRRCKQETEPNPEAGRNEESLGADEPGKDKWSSVASEALSGAAEHSRGAQSAQDLRLGLQGLLKGSSLDAPRSAVRSGVLSDRTTLTADSEAGGFGGTWGA